jgi:ceramide glucosyltransferase
MLLTLQWLLILLTSSAIFFYLWSAYCTWQFFHSTSVPPSPSTDSLPLAPAVLLVPVCGIEANAHKIWQALCEQDYPEYEVLFGVRDPADPAIPILQDLEATFPGRAKFVLCPEIRGVNLKINTLMQLLEMTRHELVVFVDSDVQVGPDYLKTVTAPLANPQTGLVTCAYICKYAKTLGAALASLGRAIDFIPSVLVARRMDDGLQFAMGATIATRRSVLNALPDYPTLVNRIGDDYHIGNMVARAGYRVELSEYVVEIDISTETVQQTYARELRWSRTIRCNRGPQYLGLGLVYGSVYSLLLVFAAGLAPWAITLCLLTYIARSLQVVVALECLQCQPLAPWVWSVPLRDGMSWLIWFLGVTGNQVSWRGRSLKVSPGGFIQENNPH